MSTINVAILGFGLSGSTFHAQLIKNITGFKITHILSRQAALIHEQYPNVQVVSNLEDILYNPQIQLVINTLPNSEHYSVTKQCLLAGKNIVVEKPFVNTISEGKELIALAKQHNLMLSVYHNRRWDNCFLTLQQQIKQLGQVYLYEAYFDRFRPQVNLAKWREQDLVGSGLLFDLGSHLIDQALTLFGMPIAIYADLAKQRPDAQATDYFMLNLIYPTHRVILGSNSVIAQPRPTIAYYASNGSYVKYGLDVQEAMLRAGKTILNAEYGIEETTNSGILTLAEPATQQALISQAGCYQQYYQGIYNHLVNGDEIPVSAESALNVIKIIHLALQSNEQQRLITL